MLSSLHVQVEEVQKREEELKRQNDKLRRESERQEERGRQLDTQQRYSIQTWSSQAHIKPWVNI